MKFHSITATKKSFWIFTLVFNKIIEEADKINKIRQEQAQPTSTKILRGIGNFFGMEGKD